MSTDTPLAPFLYSFLGDYLTCQRGMSLNTIRSYRDVLGQLLRFSIGKCKTPLTRITVEKIDVDCVLRYLAYLEAIRGNSPQTRNHRLAAIRSFFEYVGSRNIQLLDHCRRITVIPFKRVQSSPTRYLERDEVEALLGQFRNGETGSLEHYSLILFLYNTGARAQEAADLRIEHLDMEPPFRARIHGKGNKWRVCPLWETTAKTLKAMLCKRGPLQPDAPVFTNYRGQRITRFGIYHITRKYGQQIERDLPSLKPKGLNPHVLRHSTAVHLLEAGVEVNVIRGWMGHSSLDTTNRYAEINFRTKERALQACAVTSGAAENEGFRAKSRWQKDEKLLKWLQSL